jgi:hypothetical protein
MPRSGIQDDRFSTLSFELAGPPASDDAEKSEKTWRTATGVAGNNVPVIDFRLLTAMDEARRHN